jgi:hypothetical protein
MKLTYLYEAKADPNDKEVTGVVAAAGTSDETKGQSSKGPSKHPIYGATKGSYKGPRV